MNLCDCLIILIALMMKGIFAVALKTALQSRTWCAPIHHTVCRMATISEWPEYEIPIKRAYELTVECLRQNGANEAQASARYLVSDVASVGMRYSDFRAAMASRNSLN